MSNNGRPHAVRLTNTRWKHVLNVITTTDQRPLRYAAGNIGQQRRPRARLQRAHNDLSLTTQVCSWESGFCSAGRAQDAARIFDLLDGVDVGNVCGRAELSGRLPQVADQEQLRAHSSCTMFIASVAHFFADACRKWLHWAHSKIRSLLPVRLGQCTRGLSAVVVPPWVTRSPDELRGATGRSWRWRIAIDSITTVAVKETSLLVRYALEATSPAFVFLDVLCRRPESIIPVAVVR